MKQFINKNLLVIFLSFCMLISMVYLSYTEVHQRDLNQNKDWWVAYFENSKDNSLDFYIENHGNLNNFTWEVYLEKNKIFEQTVTIPKGNSKKLVVSSNDLDNKKVIVKISDGLKNKELYKIIAE